MLQLDDVRFGFKSCPDFLGPVSLTVASGQCWAIVGPNGAGKSTLLRLMAGLHQPDTGRVLLDGSGLSSLSGRERAKKITFAPQTIPHDHDYRVCDVVLMGRFPHRSLGLFESPRDLKIAGQAMSQTQTLELANRMVATLSGGEAQRVHVAAALAQEPRILLLDEPTASLDLRHQISIFTILRETANRDDRAVVIVTHDVNLAANFCTNVILLHKGRVVACGRPEDVLTPEILQPVYGIKLVEARAGDAQHRWVFPVSDAVAGSRHS